MRIAIVGAASTSGRRAITELAGRGHSITAIASQPEQVPRRPEVNAVAGDADEVWALAKLLAGHEAVVSFVRPLDAAHAELIGAVRQAGVRRYLVVGAAGSLEIAPGRRLVDEPAFPAEHKAEALAGAAYLDALKQADDLHWTFLTPATFFGPGARTGKFWLSRDTLLTFPDGATSLIFQDCHVALADEIERPRHIRKLFAHVC
jgi:uncharacterized protein